MNVEKITVGLLKSNCYIISDRGSAVIIDAGDDAEYLVSKISENNLDLKYIISTHGHFDHNLAVLEIMLNFKAKYLASKKDEKLIQNNKRSAEYYTKSHEVIPPPKIDKYLKNDDKILFGNVILKVIETPGHTPGSLCLYDENNSILFTGDLIFKNGNIGRYDFSYSNKKDIMKSIRKIIDLPEDTIVFPGHGESTTLLKEKKKLIKMLEQYI